MAHKDMSLLNPSSVGRRHDDTGITNLSQAASTMAGEANGRDVHPACGFHGADHVFGVPRGRDGQQAVSRSAKACELAGENLIEFVVVGDAGQRRGVGGQGHGCKRLTLCDKASRKLGCNMLAVRCRSAVAAEHEFFPQVQGRDDGFCRNLNVPPYFREAVEEGQMVMQGEGKSGLAECTFPDLSYLWIREGFHFVCSML